MRITRSNSAFFLSVSENKKEKLEIVIEPEEKDLKQAKSGTGVFLFSKPLAKNDNKKSGEKFLIDSPGEYEIAGVFIHGIPAEARSGEEATIYTIELEEMRLAYLAQISQKELTEEQIEGLNSIDVLMIPIAEDSNFSIKEAVKFISQIEPAVVIPSCPKNKEAKLEEFLKEMGIEDVEEIDVLSISKKDIKEEGVKIYVLSNK